MLLQYMQISLCFRIISFFKKANKLWVSTLRVQRISVKLSMVNMKKNYGPVYEKKQTLFSIGKRWPSKSWKVCFIFFLNLFYQWTNVHCVVCQLPSFWRRQRVATLYHCADRVQIGIESYSLPFHGLGIGVVHGVFKSCLPIVVFMNRTSCVLCFGCSPVEENIG